MIGAILVGLTFVLAMISLGLVMIDAAIIGTDTPADIPIGITGFLFAVVIPLYILYNAVIYVL